MVRGRGVMLGTQEAVDMATNVMNMFFLVVCLLCVCMCGIYIHAFMCTETGQNHYEISKTQKWVLLISHPLGLILLWDKQNSISLNSRFLLWDNQNSEFRFPGRNCSIARRGSVSKIIGRASYHRVTWARTSSSFAFWTCWTCSCSVLRLKRVSVSSFISYSIHARTPFTYLLPSSFWTIFSAASASAKASAIFAFVVGIDDQERM